MNDKSEEWDLMCSHCLRHEALYFLTLSNPEDPCCDDCYTELYTICPTCGRTVQQTDIVSYQSCPATRIDPAEYEVGCCNCLNVGDRDDDGPYDTLEERDDDDL